MSEPLVLVRTPTYKRPDALRRALQCLRDQTWSNWQCIVYDDDREQSGRAVCESLGDERIRYVHNDVQKFASQNIDFCFSPAPDSNADYFCILEDDNLLLPRFMEDNIALCRREKVNLILRNQFIEFDSGTDKACIGPTTVLDTEFREGRYSADVFRASLIFGIGVSNGGMFWSKEAVTPLSIDYNCTATLQEYLRTYAIAEDIYVAMEPLAVWAENGADTTRNLGLGSTYMKRELDLKRSVQKLQAETWKSLPPDLRKDFLASDLFPATSERRAIGLIKGLLKVPPLNAAPSVVKQGELFLRGLLIRFGGKTDADFEHFLKARGPYQAENT